MSDTSSERRVSPLSIVKFDASYVTHSWNGRIKIMQFVASLLCGCILPTVIGAFFTRYAFFTFVIWTTFIYVTIDLVLHLSSMCQFMPDVMKSPSILIFPVLMAALLFLLCSSLIASTADVSGRHTASAISAALGFLCMALFIVEAILLVLAIRNPTSVPTEDDAVSGENVRNRIAISQPLTRISGPLLPDPPPYTDTPTISNRGDPKLGDFV